MDSGWENNSTYSTFSWVNNSKKFGSPEKQFKVRKRHKTNKICKPVLCFHYPGDKGLEKFHICLKCKTEKNAKHVFPTALRTAAVSPPSQCLLISRESHCWVSYLWLLLLELCKSQKNLICVEVGKNILVGERFSRVSQCFDVVTEFKTKN